MISILILGIKIFLGFYSARVLPKRSLRCKDGHSDPVVLSGRAIAQQAYRY